jgi:hypothetical protein
MISKPDVEVPDGKFPQGSGTPVNDSELSGEIETNYKRATEVLDPWTEEAKEDYRFALGDQWTKEDRDALKEQSRPALTFNRIRPLINIVSGYQRENSARIKVNPEGGEDRIFSEVMDRGIKYVDKQSHLGYKMGYWFDDGLYCGKGYLEAILDYDKDPVRGELKFKQRSPYQVLPDPDCLEYDLNEGAKYIFIIDRLSKSELKELYPGKEKLINGFRSDKDDIVINGSGLDVDDDYGNLPEGSNTLKKAATENAAEEPDTDGKFTHKEYWRPKYVDKFYVIEKSSGEPRRFDTKEEAEAFVVEQAFGKVIPRKVAEMWVAAKVCGFLIQDVKSPFEPFYSGFPIFRFMADWAPNAEEEKLRTQGIVRPLKDAQREKNKAKSQYLHILNTQANSGWIGEEGALSPEGWKTLEKMGSKPGLIAKIKKGFYDKIREIQPKGPNTGQIVREEKADEEFKQISTINPDLMGMQEGTASGRAISMRIKQAVLALSRLFSNYSYSKEIVGKFILEMVPAIIDVPKLKKILGPQYMAKAVDPEKYPQGLSDGHLEAFLTMVQDNKYDVFVAEADANSTIRYEIFQELSELLKAGAPIPIELLISYMDLPNSEEVLQKIKEYQQQQLAAAGAQPAKGTPGA